jgi:predicted nucleotidyltransferase
MFWHKTKIEIIKWISTMSMPDAPSKVSLLEQRLQADWGHLPQAKRLSQDKRHEVQDAVAGFDSEDTSIVVSGSLARDEYTTGSDIDWTLLIDGSADPKHHDLLRKINDVIRPLAGKPEGAEGSFGAMVFSHNLIQEIGGEDDTNRNTTRRLLLLLESCVVGRDDAYKRVTRHLLNRYLIEDRGLWRGGSGYCVPRFLQNDFARYWRTMAVDFAYKLRNRAGKGWAIRNIKLRMSRKLIYVSGLLACYRCHLDFADPKNLEVFSDPSRHKEVADHLQEVFSLTPLEIVAGVLLQYKHLAGTAQKIFDSYNGFLGILADEGKRKDLDALKEEDSGKHEVYQEARSLSHAFRDGLLELFFDTESSMNDLTKNYGVF